ncbi:MAG: SprB repeat-containing protein [Saprospiraceae bacterium]
MRTAAEASTSYTVGEEGAITLNLSGTDVDDACNGTNSGSITVTVSGGVLPYIYNWGDIGVGARHGRT